jgi:branched-chain amino acid transport system substrate-binding protein
MNGKIHLNRKNDKLAQETFKNLIRLYPDSYDKKEAQELYDATLLPKVKMEKYDVVGVILPLSSSLSSAAAASEILEGIKFALAEYNEGRDKKIGILIRDSELSRSKLELIHDELKNVEDLKCIMGPIYSTEVKDALDVFDDINVPIISPTATDDYLIETNANFFQANPSLITRGRLMAQYVYFAENKRKIGVLNAIDGYSPILSNSFAQEFEKLSGRIVLRESYKSGSVDLKEQIKKISESLNLIEGVYIPLADRSDISIIVSFLSQINMNIPIYGDQDWMSTSGLESAAFLDGNLIFCSDYFLKFNDEDYQTFSKNFYSKTKMDVNRNILYGYDTMKYLLTIMRTSFSGSDALKQKMVSGITSAGFHNNVCFDSNRINRYMNIVRYSGGKFVLIDKFKLNN